MCVLLCSLSGIGWDDSRRLLLILMYEVCSFDWSSTLSWTLVITVLVLAEGGDRTDSSFNNTRLLTRVKGQYSFLCSVRVEACAIRGRSEHVVYENHLFGRFYQEPARDVFEK